MIAYSNTELQNIEESQVKVVKSLIF